MEHISDRETRKFVEKYGVIQSIENLKDERAIRIVNDYNRLISFPELFYLYHSTLNGIDNARKSNEHKGIEKIMDQYYDSIDNKIKDRLNNLVSSVKENHKINHSFCMSPSDFEFILDMAKDNLGYSILNYELTKSKMVILPICSSVARKMYKTDSSLINVVYCGEKFFLQKQADVDFHNFMGEITQHVGESLINRHSKIMDFYLKLLN